jgi:hypothetical protein
LVRSKLISSGSAALGLALALGAAAAGRAAQAERVLQPGDVLALKMNIGLSSKTSRAGDRFTATVSRDLSVDRAVVVPAGTTVEGHVTAVEPAKRLSKSGTIAVEFDRLVFKDGRSVAVVGQLTSLDPEQRRQIDQDEGAVQGSSTTKRNVIFIGGGAGVGAIVGAVAGGTGTGAGIGAGLGTAAVLLSKGNDAEIAPGFEFGLEILKAARIPGPGGAFGSREDLLYAQAYLSEMGMYAGPVDGRTSSTLRAAMLRFQRGERLAESGSLDDATARAIGLVDETTGARAAALKVDSVRSRSASDGGVEVTVAAVANTGGWTPFERHFVSRDTLHVFARGVPPDGPATQSLTRHEVRFSLAPDEARGVTRYVAHGVGADVAGDLGAEGGADLGALADRVAATRLAYERALGVRTLRDGSVALSGRGYSEGELELYFALNSLESSLRLYAAVAPAAASDPALRGGLQVVVRAARQVDRAIGRAGTQRTTDVERDWSGMRQEFADLAESVGASLDRDER